MGLTSTGLSRKQFDRKSDVVKKGLIKQRCLSDEKASGKGEARFRGVCMHNMKG